ncbi:transposase [Kitasatospora sp. NPDC096147]|uniref:transposase n=1 Tax=Kitasatospora sp. NPDC096147 TaxID=3364093 RepID=UPI003830D27E
MEEFAAGVFASLARSDERLKGVLYRWGLLLEDRRRSMAERLGVDYQRLQQFMTSSTWPDGEAGLRLAGRAVRAARPQMWAMDDTGFAKDGAASPGVVPAVLQYVGRDRQYQIGLSVHAVSDTAFCPMAWRLFPPEAWEGPRP